MFEVWVSEEKEVHIEGEGSGVKAAVRSSLKPFLTFVLTDASNVV